MSGEQNLKDLVNGMTPVLNKGVYVFVTATDFTKISREDTLLEFKEKEGITLILEQKKAKALQLSFESAFAWITLEIHSSLQAVGFTALFSSELAKHHISCNVIAGYYHDHIFVPIEYSKKAVEVLVNFSENYKS